MLACEQEVKKSYTAVNGWNQEKYHLMLWTKNNLQAHSLTSHLHCKSGSLFSNVQLPCDDAWKRQTIISHLSLKPKQMGKSCKLPCFFFFFFFTVTMELRTVHFKWYSQESLVPPAYKLPLYTLCWWNYIQCEESKWERCCKNHCWMANLCVLFFM